MLTLTLLNYFKSYSAYSAYLVAFLRAIRLWTKSEQSLYGVATKIIRTKEKLESPFSRVALTLGVGVGKHH